MKRYVAYLETEAGDWNIVRTVHKTADIDTTAEMRAAVEKTESPLEAWTCFQHHFVATEDMEKVHQLSMGSDTLCI